VPLDALIVRALEQGRNAMSLYQNIVFIAFGGSYAGVIGDV